MPRRRPKWASRHSPRALALLDDRVDRPPRGCQVGDRDELRPAEVLLGRLGVRRPDEQALRAKAIGQVLQAGLDGPVELADRVELLQVRDDLVLLVVRQRDGLRDRLEPLGILDVHPLGPLEEREVAERGFAEGQQLDPDAGRVAVRRHREVRARRGAGRRRRPSAGSGRARGGASPARRWSTASSASAGPRQASPPTVLR